MPESDAQSRAKAHQDAVGGVVRVSDTAEYAAWLIESVKGLTTRIRELIEHGDNRYSGQQQAGFSGLCYSPDLRTMYTWSTDGKTFASDDDGATWIEQEGVTTETDEGAFVAGREPPFVPWLPLSVKDDAAGGFVPWPLSVEMQVGEHREHNGCNER